MKVPGFSAEASLYRSPNAYVKQRSSRNSPAGHVAAAVYWGIPGGQHGFQDDGCVAGLDRIHKYSAILFDIPFGQSWEQTCASTPADVAGQHFDAPTNCVNVGPGINEWGEFYVTDPSCPCQQVCQWVCQSTCG